MPGSMWQRAPKPKPPAWKPYELVLGHPYDESHVDLFNPNKINTIVQDSTKFIIWLMVTSMEGK